MLTFVLFIFVAYFTLNQFFTLDQVDINAAIRERFAFKDINHSANIHYKLILDGFYLLISNIKFFIF